MAPSILAYRVHSLPPMLHMQAQIPMSSYSKGAQGLSVFLRVHGIFTATSISPSLWPRQCGDRYAIRAGRNEFYQPDNNEVIRRIEDRELRKEIYDAINELPDKCKEVFKLSYLHDMKNKEIADVLGVSLRTIEAHMYKALKYLRSRLDPLWIIIVLFLCK